MAVLVLYAPNPNDGTTTFDKVRFYEATDSSGSGSTLIATVSIDTSARDVEDPGYTRYTHGTGDTAKYYAPTYFNSTSSLETEKGPWTKGDRDRLYIKFQNLIGDTTNAVFDDNSVKQFRDNVVEAIFPEIQGQVIDTSLSIDKDAGAGTEVLVYDLPVGFTLITEVGIGDVDDNADFLRAKNHNWSIDGYKLHFENINEYADGDLIRLVGLKKYNRVGEIPERYDPVLLLNMQADAYDWLATRYPRFEAYSQLQDATKVSFENLRVTARELRNNFRERVAALAKGMSAEDYK